MTNVQLTQEQRELIERMGVFYEQHGIPPMEGRIMSLLIVCDEPELTFDQIRELLGISKSATSSALNMLLLTQRAIYRTKPGDRKRYFASNIVQWQEGFTENFQKFFGVIKIMKEALAQRTPKTPEFNGQMAEFIEFIEYLSVEFPRLYQEWCNRNTSNNNNQ
ncbi:GbsR/MarR family transcriptional regulator [Fluviicola chungangensis]|uniref:MarR family transcriptional regulator n=1 Tax=Fluviicola chungangensis TaxID=2597671 RepID=A0A556MQ37_9FLAO|nr:MarR family transcriptional regulator [Fluviicola chungangensis]TSJ42053.1 MarR family transcriptional regulator [Fluviicola chungangensis]